MPATGKVVDPSSALNEREIEVLRLLAGGHTVKTIAAELGRSESSVHERLCDARRKTGVGSSRELARLLDAQKIWDRKTGLSGAEQATDKGPTSGLAGRKRSKGYSPMLIVAAFSAVGLIVAEAPTGQQAMVQPDVTSAPAAHFTLAGRWRLDTAQIPANERPQRVTMTLAQWPDGRWSNAVEIVAADGTRHEGRSTAATDGVPVPISGDLGFADSVALRQPNATTLVMTLRKDGEPVSTRVYSLAKDGRSMMESISWAGQQDAQIQATRFLRVE